MTMTSSFGKVVYKPDGVTRTFAVPFRFFDASDLTLSRVRGAEIVPLTSGFSVQGANKPNGGTVLFDAAPVGADSLVILRKTPHTQETSYPEGGRFPAGTVENDFDRAVAQMQELQDGVDRSVKAPLDGSATPEELGEELFAARDAAKASADAAQLSERTAAASAQLAVDTVATALGDMEAAGDVQVSRVQTEGDVQVSRVQAEGDVQTLRAVAEADRAQSEADRAQSEANRVGQTVIMGASAHNLERTWALDAALQAHDLFTLPDGLCYWPGRNMVRLGYEGVTCYLGQQFAEVDAETPGSTSTKLRLLFAAPAGTVLNVWIVASNLARHVEAAELRAVAEADRAEGEADRAQSEADRAKTEVERAQSEVDRAELEADRAEAEADRAKDEAERAGLEADRADSEADRAAREVELARQEIDLASLHANYVGVLERLARTELRMSKLELVVAGLQCGTGTGGGGEWDENGVYTGPVVVGPDLVDLQKAGVLILTEAVDGSAERPAGRDTGGEWDENGVYTGPVVVGANLSDLEKGGLLFLTEALDA